MKDKKNNTKKTRVEEKEKYEMDAASSEEFIGLGGDQQQQQDGEEEPAAKRKGKKHLADEEEAEAQNGGMVVEKKGIFSKPRKHTNKKNPVLEADPTLRPQLPWDEIKAIQDKKLKTKLIKAKKSQREADRAAIAATELLNTVDSGFLQAEGMEKTFKFKQQDIVKEIDISNAAKHFELKLNQFGPYRADYTRNGRHLLVGGKKGHVAAFDWRRGKLYCELNLNETIRDVQWLHNETMFAVAQRKYVYIYDRNGVEMHTLRDHIDINRLDFLPYHFLLVSVGNAGYLKYHDTSTGQLVAESRTKLGSCSVMKQNPYNAVMHLGHSNGTVTLWTPNMSQPVVKMLCHRGPLAELAIDPSGRYMATAGLDREIKVWDIRTYKKLHFYPIPTPVHTMDVSQRGLLGVGFGPNIQIWKDALATRQKSPYMTHLIPSETIHELKFCPFEDVLGASHSGGFSSLIIPGSGEPNIDALENNPYETKKQRQEGEVKKLLEKLQPEMISIDPFFIGKVVKDTEENLEEMRKTEFEANHPRQEYQKGKNKARGKNTAMKRYLKKKANVMDAKKARIEQELDAKRQRREKELEAKRRGTINTEPDVPVALQRFSKPIRK